MNNTVPLHISVTGNSVTWNREKELQYITFLYRIWNNKYLCNWLIVWEIKCTSQGSKRGAMHYLL